MNLFQQAETGATKNKTLAQSLIRRTADLKILLARSSDYCSWGGSRGARERSGVSEGKIGYGGPVVGPIVGAIAAVAVVTVMVIHYSKKTAITGCVNSWGNGITFADEKDKQIYALSGDTADIKPGDRIKLQGKKVKLKGPDKTLAWEAKKVTKDFGVC